MKVVEQGLIIDASDADKSSKLTAFASLWVTSSGRILQQSKRAG